MHPINIALFRTLTLCFLVSQTVHSQSASEPNEEAPEVYLLDEIIVSSEITRTVTDVTVVPQTLTFIPEAQLDNQLFISSDLMSAISSEVPTYSPSRQKITGFGEKLRGREPLFLIDGVPQSNPLRDGSRDGLTIDPIAIESIEVLHGSSAIQGVGATGGIINYSLHTAPETDGSEGYIESGLKSSDEFSSETFGYRQAGRYGYRSGDFGFVFGGAYQWNPMLLDGGGDLIGIDNTQGDTLNSEQYDFFGNFEYALTETQEIRFFINHFSVEQELEYTSVDGDQATGQPTTSQKGATEGDPAQNKVWTGSFNYQHSDLLDGTLNLDLFYQDFAATFGGGTFGVFTNNGALVFDQSENQSEKYGSKLTYNRSFENLGGISATLGLDYINDSTQQELIQTGRLWVPETTYESYAPFIQLDRTWGRLSLSGGLRQENAQLTVDTYETLEFYGSQTVTGGKPEFDEILVNIGASFKITEPMTVYVSYAQGFGMPDVGRVLRGIDQPDQDIDTFLDLQPIVTDNYELGFRYTGNQWSHKLALFYAASDLGSRLVDNGSGFFEVAREETETYGMEYSSDWRATDQDTFGLRFGLTEGKSDTDGDGEVDTRLDGTNIPPTRLNISWQRQWSTHFSSLVQMSHYFDRDDPEDDDSFDFEGYTLFDLLGQYHLPGEWGQLALGIENVLDEQYITYYSQTAGRDDRNFAGRGRTFTLTYSKEF